MMTCLFCQIVNKKVPAEIIYQNDKILALKDIKPLAPVHLLIIPKKHIPSVDYLGPEDKALMGELILAAQEIAKDKKLKGYKLQINVGRSAGQIINHLHLHLLSGQF